jgi:hypothetical protein
VLTDAASHLLDLVTVALDEFETIAPRGVV